MSEQLKSEILASNNLPAHVAIIMDGNGRWAIKQGKMRVIGHKAGVDKVRETVNLCDKLNIKALTLFAFSSENWQRPTAEVSVLMEIFYTVLNREVKRLNKNNVRLKIIGDVSRFSNKLQKKIAESQALTANNTGLIFSVALNYGGRWDITQACKNIAEKVANGEMSSEDICEQSINDNICTHDLPELDLLIRTGGDCRISNFLLWQCAYSEFYFTDTLWPDFGESELLKALAKYALAERRFGCTSEQVVAAKK